MIKIKKVLSLLLVTVIIAGACGCSIVNPTEEETTTTKTTTTEPTTMTTTEDTATTFAENSTTKIFKGLNKDTKGDYPYEIASYTSYYDSYNETRTANLKAAVEKIDNLKIPDGYTFSFNQVVGKRTIIAGYKTAKVIANDQFVDGLGGGVCQVSSTIFESVLRANLKIVKRTNHSLRITYVPLGGDATVQWNTQDFQFKNNLGCDIRLTMTCQNGSLTCKVFAKEDKDVGDVKINITGSGNNYTLTRTVDGEINYTTHSTYRVEKTTTKKSTTKKDKDKNKDKKDKETTKKKNKKEGQ